MSLNRIQKLLFSEYCDFEDMVLVESPFAQTTREGLGLRQVQLGLTPTKLVLAIDVLPPVQESKILCDNNIDPEIETLELIAVYPVECVNLSVYRRRKRQALKAHFCNNRILYFELGGFEKKKMFWNLWCERVKFLCPEDGGSSVSETSVATSTSCSTLNIISAQRKVDEFGKPQFWCKFSKNTNKSHKCKWIEEYLYMDKINENKLRPVKQKKKKVAEVFSNQQNVIVNYSTSPVTLEPPKETESTDFNNTESSNMSQLSEQAVKDWEMVRENSSNRGRHPRKYGLMPQPHFLYGLGPWNIHTGDRVTTQLKRSVSAVRIRRQPDNPELSLPISKRLLTVSVSCEAFHMSRGLNIDTCVSKLAVPGPNALLFWTPEYWYRPQPARDSYNEFLNHMRSIKNKLNTKYSKGRRKKRRFIKRKLKLIHEGCGDQKYPFVIETSFERYLHRLRAALKIEVALTAWDFDSTTLAYQLTMIDKELFLKIRPNELQVILWQRSSKNAPNVNAIVAFSHRISCLVATEILRDDSDKIRSRLIVRFINAADKCDRISNYQSCRSILSGLQSIPIYRLHKTWAYLRLHHAVKYQLFENLCRRYSDPRLLLYQKSFYIATVSPPYLPYIGDILSKLLDKVPLLENFEEQTPDNEKENKSTKKLFQQKNVPHKLIKFLSGLKIWPIEPDEINKSQILEDTIQEKSPKVRNIEISNEYEDNRFKKLQEVDEFLNVAQKSADKYALSKNDLAQEYLLKARYREDKENFFNFKLEH